MPAGRVGANACDFIFPIDGFTCNRETVNAACEELANLLKGVAQHTEISDIRAKLKHAKGEKRPLRVKLGLDPSAPDIHIRHSVVLRKIRQLQNLGHIAVIIIGDYTGMIGDPTGKSKTRKPLTPEQVKANAETYI